jgi:hypothetical protein
MSNSYWLMEKLRHMVKIAETLKSVFPGVYYETGA